MAFGGGPLQLLLQLAPESLLAGVEKRYVLADGLIGLVAVNARRSRIPGGDPSLDIQQVECVILYPGGNGTGVTFRGRCPVVENQ